MSADLQLKVPKIQLTELSFTHSSAEAFEHWQEGLPKANLGELSRQLYHCFLEFNQLAITPEKRLLLLEKLRPLTYFTLEALSKHYLNSSLDLNPHQRKAANLAQSLQNHLAVGYKHVILGLLKSGETAHLPTALHRALTELSLTYLRACHLYCPVPEQLWLECHQLFKLAHQHQLLDELIDDKENTPKAALSILNTYKRLLLFSLSNSNHLRQKEQQRVFSACSVWCREARLLPPPGEGLFAVDLGGDHPPTYLQKIHDPESELLWFLDTQQLRDHLITFASQDEEDLKLQQDLPTGVDPSMLQHLIKAWGPMMERAFDRSPSEDRLQLSIGFSATHYFLAGEEEFSLWLESQGSDQQQRYQPETGEDAWSKAVDVTEDDLMLNQRNEPLQFNQPSPELNSGDSNYPLYEVQVVDASPGGYRILWQNQIPAQLQAGELLGIRQDHQHWHLAVVRWLRLLGNQKILAGLELVGPNAHPGAIAVVRKSGDDSQYMRCFLLPGVPATGQQTSLLTPRISFQVGYKVRIADSNHTYISRLVECCEQTGSFAQFLFHAPNKQSVTPSNEEPPQEPSSQNDQDFDNLWDKL